MPLLGALGAAFSDPYVRPVVELAVHSYWVLCTTAAVVALLPPWNGIDWFRNAVIVSACRGKLTDDCPKDALGPLSNVFVPQRWFSHFYAIGCLSNALVLYTTWDRDNQTAVLLLGAFQLHVIRRLIETVWMMRYPKQATMHVMAYAFGMSYYVIVPVTYLLAATPRTPSAPHTCWSASLGMTLFAAGSLIQWHAHHLLAHLGSKSSANTRYVIPRGGLFKLISCPHYFGEAVIYLGLGIACGPTRIAAWYPFVWVVANLTLAAGMTHRWYLTHFTTYRRLGRKAFIPFIY